MIILKYLRKFNIIIFTDLLKSIQMIGKQSDNHFTPLQKLSDVTLAMKLTNNNSEAFSNSIEFKENRSKLNSTKNDFQDHPTFGFKAGLIRIIGNISYKNKEYQDLVSIKFLFFIHLYFIRNILYVQYIKLLI